MIKSTQALFKKKKKRQENERLEENKKGRERSRKRLISGAGNNMTKWSN